MRTLVLEINEQKKREIEQLLLELKRLNIRILFVDGKAVTDMEEIGKIVEAPAGSVRVQAATVVQTNTTQALQKGARKASSSLKTTKEGKRKNKSDETVSWQFSNHVFPGIAQKTFSRQEIYEDAEWEKNLH